MVASKATLLTLLVAAATAATHDYPSYSIPAFDLNNLSDADAAALVAALKANGLINLKNIPDFDATRSAYMEAAANCIANTPDFPEKLQKTLRDGTIKDTLSTSVRSGVPASVAAACPDYAALYAKYSALLDLESIKLAWVLDRAAGSNSTALVDFASEGEHLDHFHAYANPPTPQFEATNGTAEGEADLSLEFHIDGGGLLETSEPLFFNRQAGGNVVPVANPDPRTGLIVELNGEGNRRVRPTLKRDELTIMIGQGFEAWGAFDLKLQAVNHGMLMPRNAASSVVRGFSGRMLLLQSHVKMANTGLTFGEYGKSITRHLMAEDDSIVSLACPVGRQLMAMDGACKVGVWSANSAPKNCKKPKTNDQCMAYCNNEHNAGVCGVKEDCCVLDGERNDGINCWMVCTLPFSPDVCAVQECQGQKNTCKVSKIPTTVAPTTAAPTTAAPTTVAPTTAAPTTAAPTTAAPTTAAPTTAAPTTAAPTTAAPTTAAPTTAAPTTAAPTTAAPTTAAPTTASPTTAAPTTAAPTTAAPTTAAPTTAAPTTAAPTTAAPTTAAPADGEDIQLCTFTQKILSEYNNQVYADLIRGNINEKLVYSAATQTVSFKSNGQCLDAFKDGANFELHTYACDAKNVNQRWVLADHRLKHAIHESLCVVVNPYARGDLVRVEACSDSLAQHVDKCTGATPNLVQIQTCKANKPLSEAFTGLYADSVRNNVNELFEFTNGMIKAASNGECLDAFQDGASFGLHTYKCDPNNNNQKWYMDNSRIKHATHNNLCLDADPTDNQHKAQVYQCFPNNDNQCWKLIAM